MPSRPMPTHRTEPWFQRMIAALEAHARAGRTAIYAELVAEAEVPPPHRIHKLTEALEELTTLDHESGAPLRAAVAVSKARDGLPGPGFFQHCQALGRYFGPDRGPQAATFHKIELNRLIVSFRSHN